MFKHLKNLILITLLVGIMAIPSLTNANEVNWNQGVITAIGTGVIPANVHSQAQGKAMAHRSAVVDAYRNIAELISGVKVEGNTTVKNYEVTSDVIRTSVSAVINNARIIDEEILPDGTCVVTMQIGMYGENSLASALTPQIGAQATSFPLANTNYQPANSQTYTGIVVDARGLGLERVMCPRVYDESGRIVYGNMYVDPNIIVNKGIVDYDTVSEVASSRAGSSPIVVKALSLRDFNSNVVISNADADKILSANSQSNFLTKTAVVFQQ